MANNCDTVLAQIDTGLDDSLKRLFELIAIPSISTDPAHAPDCTRAAEWLAGELGRIGFDASVRETRGLPMVVGHVTPEGVPDDALHVLFYGHYDVQPADPLELWTSPPFEPRLEEADGARRIVARGAADDKGQLMTFVEACRAWHEAAGGPPVKVSVLFEGEEESGSSSLGPFLEENADEIRADLVLVCDTNMWDAETPAVTTGLRGLLLEEVVVTGPAMDLHSGLYGGAAANPIRALSSVLAALHGADGEVMIPGFYEGVRELPQPVADQWKGLGFDEAAFLADIGQSVAAGEKGRSVLEQIWSRPTCDVNGIFGGYTGEGTKTVIPARATAKISFRLVGAQNPEAIRKAFRAFVEAKLPQGYGVEFIAHGASPGIEIPADNVRLQQAAGALEAEFGKAPVMMGCGGSIPIVEQFKTVLDMESLLIGFGLNDDRIHSPNEKYDLSSFHKGARSWARILAAFAGAR